MNKSAKGFGLLGVVAAVVVLMVSAMVSARAEAANLPESPSTSTEY